MMNTCLIFYGNFLSLSSPTLSLSLPLSLFKANFRMYLTFNKQQNRKQSKEPYELNELFHVRQVFYLFLTALNFVGLLLSV